MNKIELFSLCTGRNQEKTRAALPKMKMGLGENLPWSSLGLKFQAFRKAMWLKSWP